MDPFGHYRAEEAHEAHRVAVLISGTKAGVAVVREDLLHVCIAWLGSGATWECPQVPNTGIPSTSQGMWLWLWEGCSVQADDPRSMYDLLDGCGLPYEDAARLLLIAQRNRLVYPDGTLNTHLQSLSVKLVTALQVPS